MIVSLHHYYDSVAKMTDYMQLQFNSFFISFSLTLIEVLFFLNKKYHTLSAIIPWLCAYNKPIQQKLNKAIL